LNFLSCRAPGLAALELVSLLEGATSDGIIYRKLGRGDPDHA
jgi:hypothetical protein